MLFALVLILGMLGGYALRERLPYAQGFFQSSQRNALQEVMDIIKTNYVDTVSADSLGEDAIEAMLARLDPHSVYIPAKYLQEKNEDLQGNFEGIGVEFQIIRDTVNVVQVLTGGPSAQAGVQVGDKFIAVGDSLIAGNGITTQRIKNLLRGPGASRVNLTLLSDGRVKKVEITRGTIPLYSVDAAYMVNDTTGYIHLNKFSSTSYEECMAAFEKLNRLGMKKLLFDLRGNGGGILSEAVDISDEFLSGEKLIVYTRGDKQERVDYRAKRPGQFESGELMVLVDEGSASASEVVAGAIQDWDRGTIIGRRTFGKGLVQEQYELGNGAALRLTVARYYTPSGRSIQRSYANGRSAYYDEVLGRFHDGTLQGDTIAVQHGKAYHTNGGRLVYGGGGIAPDVVVPFDTAGLSEEAASLFENQHFGKFIYQYYVSDKAFFDQFGNPKAFNARFEPNASTWARLVNYFRANNFEMPDLSAADRAELEKRIKSWMARQIWGTEGYYEVANTHDHTVSKALAL